MKNAPIRRINPKVSMLHDCSQKEQIAQLISNTNKLSVIITGNGNPKEGYVFKVEEMGKNIGDINTKLTGITGIVSELHDESIGKKAMGKSAVEIKDEIRAKRGEFIKMASFVIVTLAFCVSTYFSIVRGNEVKRTVEEELLKQKSYIQNEKIDSLNLKP